MKHGIHLLLLLCYSRAQLSTDPFVNFAGFKSFSDPSSPTQNTYPTTGTQVNPSNPSWNVRNSVYATAPTMSQFNTGISNIGPSGYDQLLSSPISRVFNSGLSRVGSATNSFYPILTSSIPNNLNPTATSLQNTNLDLALLGVGGQQQVFSSLDGTSFSSLDPTSSLSSLSGLSSAGINGGLISGFPSSGGVGIAGAGFGVQPNFNGAGDISQFVNQQSLLSAAVPATGFGTSSALSTIKADSLNGVNIGGLSPLNAGLIDTAGILGNDPFSLATQQIQATNAMVVKATLEHAVLYIEQVAKEMDRKVERMIHKLDDSVQEAQDVIKEKEMDKLSVSRMVHLERMVDDSLSALDIARNWAASQIEQSRYEVRQQIKSVKKWAKSKMNFTTWHDSLQSAVNDKMDSLKKALDGEVERMSSALKEFKKVRDNAVANVTRA